MSVSPAALLALKQANAAHAQRYPGDYDGIVVRANSDWSRLVNIFT